MKSPGALIRIPITVASDADLARFETALEKLADSDPQVEIQRTPARQRIILGALNEPHLERAADRLIREHGVEYRRQLQFGTLEIAYLETISRAVDQDYTHKRQSGGTGQFARIKVRFEPLPSGAGYRFKNDVITGSVPPDFVPGVERGLESARKSGPISGFPVTDFQATLLDGAYHDVDSSALTFELAARGCFKEAMSQARPVLLEPIMQLETEVPAEAADGVKSDLKTRRAMTLRSQDRNGGKLVTAFVPLSNLFGYQSALSEITERRSEFRLEFDHYGRIPGGGPDLDDPHPGSAIGLRPA